MPRARFALRLAVVLAGAVALLAPAVPALLRYGALPSTPDGAITLLLAGVTPNYLWNSSIYPRPPTPEDFTGITDTIVLAQLQPDGGVHLLSIPRDTWIKIPGTGVYGKVNGANPHGGPTMLVNAIQSLTGLHVDAYALLSLNALRDLTEAAGGVSLTVPENMKYDDEAAKLHIDLKAGLQHLNGTQAEGFLRFRHDALGDIGRVSRQQLFLTALAAHLKSPLNVWRIPAVVGAINRNARSNLTRQDFGRVLGALLNGTQVSTSTLPGSFGPGGTWTPDRAAIRTLMQLKFADPTNPRRLNVTLVNVNAAPGTARKYKAQLEAAGYLQVSTATQTGTLPKTTFSGPSAAGHRLMADLGFDVQGGAPGSPGTDLTVQLGADAK